MTKLNLTRPLVFLDLETTGVNIVTDRIVEISLHKININGTTETKTLKINPTIPIPKHVTAIHGISDEDVKDCPTFVNVAKTLFNFIENADLAGYNSNKFDIPMLVEEFLRADINFEIKNRRLVDVQNIFHKMEQRTLKAAYKFYCGKDLVNAHTAEADTLATYEVLLSQLERYENTTLEDDKGNKFNPIVNDVQALHDFSYNSKNADLVGHLVFNEKGQEVINFGKHKGKVAEEIFKIEPSYYDWMMKSDFPLSTKQVITAIKLRSFNNSSVNITK